MRPIVVARTVTRPDLAGHPLEPAGDHRPVAVVGQHVQGGGSGGDVVRRPVGVAEAEVDVGQVEVERRRERPGGPATPAAATRSSVSSSAASSARVSTRARGAGRPARRPSSGPPRTGGTDRRRARSRRDLLVARPCHDPVTRLRELERGTEPLHHVVWFGHVVDVRVARDAGPAGRRRGRGRSEPQAGPHRTVVGHHLADHLGRHDLDRGVDEDVVGLAVRSVGRIRAATHDAAPARTGQPVGAPAHMFMSPAKAPGRSPGAGRPGWRVRAATRGPSAGAGGCRPR